MKRFNYTERKKIFREDVKIKLQGDFQDKPKVDITIDFKDYELPADGHIYLEPYWKTRIMRIYLGQVTKNVKINNLELNEFDDAEGIAFRVKVIDKQEGKLLGIAENIKPYNEDNQLDDNQKSILPVASVDLSSYGVLWRIEYNDQEAVLQIEKELGLRNQVVRSQLFEGFILPAAMRQILVKVTAEDWDEDLTEPEELSTRWLLFTKQMGAGLPEIITEDGHEEWIDNAVRILSNRIGVRQQIIDDFDAGVWK